VHVPAGTPHAIVTAPNRQLVAVLHEPDFAARLAAEAFDVVASTPKEFAAFVHSEIVKWADVVTKAGIPAP
jgi:tripartite-type tricarboxylate transporter receptor subunit TctC